MSHDFIFFNQHIFGNFQAKLNSLGKMKKSNYKRRGVEHMESKHREQSIVFIFFLLVLLIFESLLGVLHINSTTAHAG